MPPRVPDFVYLSAQELGGASGPAQLRIPTDGEADDDDIEDPEGARTLHLALKASGVARVYCRYDGGNDEGFAWVDHAELDSGERIELAALGKRLIANGVSVPKRMPWQKDWSDERVVCDLLDFPLAVNWAAALLGGRGFGTGEYWMYGAFIVDLVAETITDDATAIPIVRNVRIEGVERMPGRFAPGPVPEASQVFNSVSTYNVGDRVVHARFGGGTVVGVDGNKLLIVFDSGQRAHVIDSFVDRE
jgi:hypothetical protein